MSLLWEKPVDMSPGPSPFHLCLLLSREFNQAYGEVHLARNRGSCQCQWLALVNHSHNYFISKQVSRSLCLFSPSLSIFATGVNFFQPEENEKSFRVDKCLIGQVDRDLNIQTKTTQYASGLRLWIDSGNFR